MNLDPELLATHDVWHGNLAHTQPDDDVDIWELKLPTTQSSTPYAIRRSEAALFQYAGSATMRW